MNNPYLNSRNVSLSIVFLFSSFFAIGQRVENIAVSDAEPTLITIPPDQILSKGEVAEQVWQSSETKWENDMVASLATTNQQFQQFLAYNNSIFSKDRGVFFTGFSRGTISDVNAGDFFDGLANKYSALYSQFAILKANHPEEITSAINARYTQPLPSPQTTCNPACDNIDFSNGTLSAWSAYYGEVQSTAAAKNIVNITGGPCASVTQAGGPDANTGNDYQVQLMTTGGVDPIAGTLIPLTPPLGGLCTMIGDGPTNGAGYGLLKQQFIVSAANTILTLQYAVVLENPGHQGWQQPWFQIEVLDSNNNPIPGCGQYFVISTSNLPGFVGIPYSGDTVWCKPWTTVFVPLTNYVGQCVTVQIEAADCALGGHFGYGYVAATCGKLNLVSSSNVFCTGQTSAVISGPPGGVSYQWSTTNGCISGLSTAQNVTVTCAGTYNLVTTSGASCVDSFSINIPAVTAGPPPRPCFTADTVCSGNPTHFNASCSSPSSGTKYYWDFYNNGAYEDSSGATPTWTYGGGGYYYVRLHTVTTAGCGADTIIKIPVDSTNNGTRPSVTLTTVNATACNLCNGSRTLKFSTLGITQKITITNSCNNQVITFTPPGSISLAGGGCGLSISSNSVSINCTGVCPGTCYYYVKPFTASGPTICSPNGWAGDTLQSNVGVTGVNITTNQITSPATCGHNNGSASLSASGGTPPYTFTWSNGLGTNASVSGLSAGTYTITIVDSAGCSQVTIVNIQSLPALSALVTPYFVSCYGSTNGAVKVTPVGGTGPYTYRWSPNVTTADSTGGLSAGTYSITITDASSCTGTATATIVQPTQLKDTVTGTFTNLACLATGNGTVTPTGGYAPYSYHWSNGATAQSDTGLAPGTFFFTITDANGCTLHDSIRVTTVCSTGHALFYSSDSSFCDESGKCIHFFDQSTNNPTSWHWLFPGATPDSSSLQNPDSICYFVPGTYPVTLIACNAGGCDTLAVNPMITFGQAPLAPTITVHGDTLISSPAYHYQWYLNGSPIPGATDSFYVCTQSGLYSVQITNNLGCAILSGGVSSCITGIDELSADVIKIYPNPAGDEFTVYGVPFTDATALDVYNVLGQKVYSCQLKTPNSKPQTVNCKSFASGMYFVRISDGQQQLVGKIVVEK